MSQHLPKHPSLLIVSDTAMFEKNGRAWAFGPVVREMDVFLELFEKVVWIGFERKDRFDDPTMEAVPDGVECIYLPPSGGKGLRAKLGVLLRTPLMWTTIFGKVLSHEVIHSRAPSSPAFLAAILSGFFPGKIWWHKYAGNWAQEAPPFFYGLQRWWLSRARWSKVTINGHWPDQPAHCLSFENPCLTEEDRQAGAAALAEKRFAPPWQLCFVGRLETAKGVGRILDALAAFPKPEQIEVVHFVGDGPERAAFERKARGLPVQVQFHGFLPREQVFEIYRKSQFFLLPSDSEGFPKVVAEAANFGCIPVVSTVSSIPHYIRDGDNGFLWETGESFSDQFCSVLMDKHEWRAIASRAREFAGKFTFERYRHRIQTEILQTKVVSPIN